MVHQYYIFISFLPAVCGRLNEELKSQQIWREEEMTFGSKTNQLKISMPLVETTYPDQYICHAKSLGEIDDSFLLNSVIVANREYVHHVATGVCENPVSTDVTWDCTQQQGSLCRGDAVNFGGWDEFTKKNGKFEFPKDVSLRVGSKTGLKYLLIEIHFRDRVRNPKFSVANVTLDFTKSPTMFSYQTYTFINSGFIPGNKGNGYMSEAACQWKRPPAYAFRYFLHTHHYGILAEGFLIRNGTWIVLGSQLSVDKKKDLYDIPGGPIEIRPGDIVASRCLYINDGPEPVNFGMSEHEEMCNFQLELGYDPKYADHYRRPPACVAKSPTFKFCDYPETKGLC